MSLSDMDSVAAHCLRTAASRSSGSGFIGLASFKAASAWKISRRSSSGFIFSVLHFALLNDCLPAKHKLKIHMTFIRDELAGSLLE
jgi:hypothetical protein